MKAEIFLDSVFIIAQEYNLLNHFFIDVLAYDYSSRNKNEMLFEILKNKIELYPQSSEAYESLAYAYYKKNEFDLALKYYKYLLELNPKNPNALKMLDLLQNP